MKPEAYYLHQIICRTEASAENARSRVIYHVPQARNFEIFTEAGYPNFSCYFLRFLAPRSIDLDFLRPDILGPKSRDGDSPRV